MTTSFKKRRNKKILALCLSAFMLSIAATSFAACGDNNDSSVDGSEVSTNEKDTARIANGSFEIVDDNNGRNLIITSPKGWSKSTNSSAQGSASTSKTASGILDTSESAWKNLTESSGLAHATESEAKANWSSLTPKDKLEFYDSWQDEDENNKLSDLSFYDKDKDNFNISIDDIPDCKNPGTHYAADAEDKDKNTNVLMLHNSYTDGHGTAQKYTSSTKITLEPGTSAIFSVWVKTSDMTYDGTSEKKGDKVNGERGAYIGVTHEVGGTPLDQMQIKNIDTEAINPEGKNNGWVQYSVSLKGCSYASSSFTVVLGLGQGGSTDKMYYVDGYAFFDDVQCNVVSNDSYDEEVNKLPADNVVSVFTDAEDKLFETDKHFKDQFAYAIDLHTSFDKYSLAGNGKNWTKGLTEEEYNGESYVSAPAEGKKVYGDLALTTKNDLIGLYSVEDLKANTNKYIKRVMADDFEEYPFEDSDDLLMLLSADGAAYTAKLEDDAFTLTPDSYMMISFWLKTSDIGGFTGAGVTVTEKVGTNETSLSSLDTTSITTVDIDDLKNEGETIEDIYDGWQQCFLFLQNTTENDKSFSLSFTYGPTAIVGTTNNSYHAGYAAFSNFETCDMTKQQFAYAATGTYAKSVSLTGDETDAATDAAFDSAASLPDKQIEKGLAMPKNYKGVNGGSGYVSTDPTDKEVNGYKYAGLVNKKYAANYRAEYQKGDSSYWLNKMAASAGITVDNEDKWWNALFGTATQPLVVYNDAKKSYGYLGSSQTISSGSYATVSVKVKVSAGATAYLYLIDTTENKYAETLTSTTPKYTYWYDKDGNVCAKDPTDKKFDKKKDVAFHLDTKNGLYKANADWSGYKEEMAGKYYANLSNYEKDSEGNLLVKDGGVSYNYDASKWQHQGNDGIAFYCDKATGKYYAYKNYSTEVTDLATIDGLARYTNTDGEKKNLMMTVEGDETNGEWVTCTFYIHTGNLDKNYRLEVWSGTRDGAAETQNPAGSYVVFDANKPDAVDSKFTALVDEVADMIKKDNDWTTDEEFKAGYDEVTYHAFSFFDSPSFLRYDSTLDKDEIGNKYTSYDATSYAEGISYLYYENTQTAKNNPLYTMFVDYSYTEVSVTADSTEGGGDSNDPTEDKDNTNMWLFVSSLVIAIALIIAVIGLAVQKLIKKAHLKKARAGAGNASSLNAAKRRYTKKTDEKKADVKEEEPKDDNDPYND